MMTYDYYGVFSDRDITTTRENAESVDAICHALSSALGIEFSGHYSDHWNGDYYEHESDEFGTIMVLNNVNERDPEELPSMEFAEYRVYVSVEEARAADDVRERLTALGLNHLRRIVE